MMDRATLGWRPYALLLLLCLGLYLPGISSLPVTDRDEARFAQATRQMLETRDFIAIRFQDEARNKKPAGIYWLQAASVALFSTADSNAIWPYRLPSLLGAAAASLLTFGMGAAVVGKKAAFLGAALLASSLGLVIEAHLAKTDAVLLACVTAAQLALARIYVEAREGKRTALSFTWLFWFALALGILIKGPVAPVVAALTIVALTIADREWRWLRALHPIRGLAIVAVIVLPWLIAISSATGGAFLSESLGHDFLGKLIGAQESHGAPPLYYLLLLTATFWPSTLFIAPAVAWAWQKRSETAARFLIAWAVPFWIVLELVPTKLPNYLLPAFPALALACGSALVAAGDSQLRSWRWADRLSLALWTAVTLGLAAALLIVPSRYGNGIDVAAIIAGGLALLLGWRMLRAGWRGIGPSLAARAALFALLVLSIGFEFVAPSLDQLWLSRAASSLIAKASPTGALAIAATGYAEPSLVFMLGTRTMLLAIDNTAQYLASTPGALALVEAHNDAAFRTALASRGFVPKTLGQVGGLDYSNGRAMTLTLYSGAPR